MLILCTIQITNSGTRTDFLENVKALMLYSFLFCFIFMHVRNDFNKKNINFRHVSSKKKHLKRFQLGMIEMLLPTTDFCDGPNVTQC